MMIYRSVILDFIIQRPENVRDGLLLGKGWRIQREPTNQTSAEVSLRTARCNSDKVFPVIEQ